MKKNIGNRPLVLSIGGFDPCAGAGVLADIKTFNSFNCYGMAVCTATTVQSENMFLSCAWLEEDLIIKQLQTLLVQYHFDFVKISLVPSWEFILKLTKLLQNANQHCKIILDPVIKASAGFHFHNKVDQSLLEQVLKSIYLITPNIPEALFLSQNNEVERAVEYLKSKCNLLLKGGHGSNSATVLDQLFVGNKVYKFESIRIKAEKHGTGCVLAAAISALLSKGESLENACERAKNFLQDFLQSGTDLLGVH